MFRERPLLAIKLRTAVIRRHGENVASTLQTSGRRELRTRVDTDVALTLADGSETTCRLENLSGRLPAPAPARVAGREAGRLLPAPAGG